MYDCFIKWQRGLPLDTETPADAATQPFEPIPALHFDTGAFPARDTFDAWRAIMGEIYEVLPSTFLDTFAFAADLKLWNVAGVTLTAGTFTPQRFARDARRARRDGLDHYTVLLHRQGQWVAETDDRSISSLPGRLCFLDFARPVVSDVTWNDSITLSVPRDMLDRVLPPRDLHGLALDGAAAELLGDFLEALTRRIGGLHASAAPHLAGACAGLLAACLAPSRPATARVQPELEALTYGRARRLIDANLHNPSLGAEELALMLRVSRSTLYRVFERFGGVAEQIRARRLARAHDLLAQTRGQLRVSEVARMCGFSSDTYFSRAFREAYGYSPREAMMSSVSLPRVPSGGEPGARGDIDLYIDWIRRLGL